MPQDKTISLPAGSRFIPVLCDAPVPAADIFGPLGNSLLLAYDLQNQLLYWPQGQIYTLEYLEPGTGYLVSMAQPGEISFNCDAKSTIENFVAAKPKEYHDAPWAFNKTGSAHFISVSAEALNGLQPGDYIGVFNTAGECVGFERYEGGNANLLVVAYGDDFTTDQTDGLIVQEDMSFRIFSSAGEVPVEVAFDPSMPDAGAFAETGRSKILKMVVGSSVSGSLLNDVSLHPNPNDGTFYINLPAFDQTISVEIVGAAGQIIYRQNLTNSKTGTNHAIELSPVNPGVYFVRITGNNETVIRKMVVR